MHKKALFNKNSYQLFEITEKLILAEDIISTILTEEEKNIFYLHLIGYSQREISKFTTIGIGSIKYLFKK